jgi:hypothetical protein
MSKILDGLSFLADNCRPGIEDVSMWSLVVGTVREASNSLPWLRRRWRFDNLKASIRRTGQSFESNLTIRNAVGVRFQF